MPLHGPISPVLVVDDLISSGATMRLSREALSASNVVNFGFAWGCH